MRRRFRTVTVKSGGREYLALLVEWQDEHGAWHSRTVKSYGVATDQAIDQAQRDLNELQRVARNPESPIPAGTINDAIWAGFVHGRGNPLSIPALGPALAVRDLIHLGAYLIANASGNLREKVMVTQPEMPSVERTRFISWLQEFTAEDQAVILTYQWRYEP